MISVEPDKQTILRTVLEALEMILEAFEVNEASKILCSTARDILS